MQAGQPTHLTRPDIRSLADELGVAGAPVELHSSMRSFGRVEGGPDAVIDGLLDARCTVLVPTFSWNLFGQAPGPGQRPPRNGADYALLAPRDAAVFDPASNQLDVADMGVIPRSVLARPGRVRGNHPLSSFAAVGPLAGDLIGPQTPADVWAPLRALCDAGGAVVLAGVGLNRMTLLHVSEHDAGRRPFVRWAASANGTVMVHAGGCSSGFEAFEPVLRPIERRRVVGHSTWRAFDAGRARQLATEAIGSNPRITVCSTACVRCADAVAGGPDVALDA